MDRRSAARTYRSGTGRTGSAESHAPGFGGQDGLAVDRSLSRSKSAAGGADVERICTTMEFLVAELHQASSVVFQELLQRTSIGDLERPRGDLQVARTKLGSLRIEAAEVEVAERHAGHARLAVRVLQRPLVQVPERDVERGVTEDHVLEVRWDPVRPALVEPHSLALAKTVACEAAAPPVEKVLDRRLQPR